jgi:hypothetical protein
MGKKRRKANDDKKIELYKHPIGQEMGLINLVVPSPPDPNDDDRVTMILTSEYTIDEGVVFTVEMYQEDYQDMCNDHEITTMEGATLSTFGETIRVEEVPEEPPFQVPEIPKGKNTLRVLMTPNLWTHPWGRCCCVKRGEEHFAVTRETIAEGKVSFWNSNYTPYELDMIEAAMDPEHKAMHVLLDNDLICGCCGHNVWTVFPEDVPAELPQPPQYVEVESPLFDDLQALDEIIWTSKREAWEIFYEDEHNNSLIFKSGLAVERSNNRKRYSQEKMFEPFNRAHGLGRNIYTIKQAFYAALGNTKTGTWADFDLKMLRMIKGLEEVDLPAEIIDMVRLDDDEDKKTLKEKLEQRATKATVDEEATILHFMLNDEAIRDDDDEEDEIRLDFDDEDEDDDVPEVREPIRQVDPRPKAVPRVQKPKKQTKRPTVKNRVTTTTNKAAEAKQAKTNLISACNQLQSALAAFVQTLQDDEEKDDGSSNGGAKRAGG